MSEETFKAERLTGVGGSDLAAVFNLEPYGCALRLWRVKREQPPDYEVQATGPMLRGEKLESIVAQEYAERTGRRIEKAVFCRHPDHPEWMVHRDYIVYREDRPDPGPLSVKTVGREQFYKVKREGLPHGYTLQLQSEMAVSNAQWGAFVIGWMDGWEFRFWDTDADLDIRKAIQDEVLKFWVQVQNGPAPDALPPNDPRCQKCAWRTQCQGEALKKLAGDDSAGGYDAGLRQLAEDYLEARELADEADAVKEGAGDRLREAMANRTAAETVGARIIYRPVTSMRYDTAALNKIPGMEKYKKPSVSRPLKVYPI